MAAALAEAAPAGAAAPVAAGGALAPRAWFTRHSGQVNAALALEAFLQVTQGRARLDAAAALRAAGLPPAPGAVAVVTPAQAQALDDMLADWEAGALAGGYVACDEIAARVADALLRARAANAAWVRRR